MGINAVFFGSDSGRVSARFVSAGISALSMIPVERLSPRLFAFINTFRAESLDVSYAVRQQRAKDIAARKSRAIAALDASVEHLGAPSAPGFARNREEYNAWNKRAQGTTDLIGMGASP